MTQQYTHKKTNSLYFIAASLIYLLTTLILTSGKHLIYRVVLFFLILFIVKSLQKNLLRHLIALPLALSFALDLCLTLYCWFTYHEKFNSGFALSIIDTDPTLAGGMLKLLWQYLVLFFVLFMLFFKAMQPEKLPRPKLRWSISLLILITTFSSFRAVQYFNSHLKTDETTSSFQILTRLATYLPWSNLHFFLKGVQDNLQISRFINVIPNYELSTNNTGVDTYVIVVGESVRRSNMSVYGYEHPTTPALEEKRKELTLFTDVISGAPITALAVPLAMTADTVAAHNTKNYTDNIINLANAAGFRTYWYSTQDALGNRGISIAGLAMHAKDKRWIQGLDGKLLPLTKKALQEPAQKKLIILHINGSHTDPCQRYPHSITRFNKQNDGLKACYDNSILYTDQLHRELFNELKDQRAALLYFSDHAVEFTPNHPLIFTHGGLKPSQEAYQIPMFIWYSPLVKNPLPAVINERFSSSQNYHLIRSWLGIVDQRYPQLHSISNVIEHFKGESQVLNSESELIDFNKLKK